MQFKMVLFPILLLQLASVAFSFRMPDLKEGGKVWAVLVAGSNGYWNYRHQADICHAYQLLHSHGVPDSQIIVLMYDDIALNEENPTPGVIINHLNGSDVYHNVLKDYVGDAVTPYTFMNVLLGNKEAVQGLGSGRVLESGPDDHVFVNFADHGATGLLGFPDDILSANDLISTIEEMYSKHMYNKLVFYVEACEAGSMFENILPTDINAYALTASNSDESSYACYYDDHRNTYLGDLFSVNWMEDSDVEQINKETISQQYVIVKNETDLSPVMQYGDLTISKLTVGEFQGSGKPFRKQRLPTIARDAVPAPDVPLELLKKKLQKATNSKDVVEIQKKIQMFHKNRAFMDTIVHNILERSVFNTDQLRRAKTQQLQLNNYKCYDKTVKYFSKKCFSVSKNEYSFRQMYKFVNLCEMGIEVSTIKAAMDSVCTHLSTYGIH